MFITFPARRFKKETLLLCLSNNSNQSKIQSLYFDYTCSIWFVKIQNSSFPG